MNEPVLGFKIVTVENILETDPVVSAMVVFNLKSGESRPHQYDDWVRDVMAVELSSRVPFEVRRMFAFSQGALCYAHWYYPALTLGILDMLRVAEFAIAEACRERDINQPTGKKFLTFSDNIRELVKANILEQDDNHIWNTMREHRNRTIHPAAQFIYGFNQAYETLKTTSQIIERIKWLQK